MMKRIAYALIVLVVIYGISIARSHRSPGIPTAANAVQVVLRMPQSKDVVADTKVSDVSKVEALLKTLSRGTPVADHKCASLGTLNFQGDSDFTVTILPGRDEQFYEFRYDSRIFQVPREAFIDALVATGIDQEAICLDGHP